MPVPGNSSAYQRAGLVLGRTGSQLDVDSIGQIAVVAKDPNGVTLFSAPSGQYSQPLIMRQTAALAIGSTVWAIHNPPAATKTVHIRHMRIEQMFDGVPTAQTTLVYSLARFAGTSVDTGTGLGTPIKWRSSYAASSVVGKVDGGTAITGTGIVYETPFAYVALSLTENVVALPGAATMATAPNIVHEFTFGDNGSAFGGFELAPSEGFGIRVTSVPTIVGSVLSGYVEFEER